MATKKVKIATVAIIDLLLDDENDNNTDTSIFTAAMFGPLSSLYVQSVPQGLDVFFNLYYTVIYTLYIDKL